MRSLQTERAGGTGKRSSLWDNAVDVLSVCPQQFLLSLTWSRQGQTVAGERDPRHLCLGTDLWLARRSQLTPELLLCCIFLEEPKLECYSKSNKKFKKKKVKEIHLEATFSTNILQCEPQCLEWEMIEADSEHRLKLPHKDCEGQHWIQTVPKVWTLNSVPGLCIVLISFVINFSLSCFPLILLLECLIDEKHSQNHDPTISPGMILD